MKAYAFAAIAALSAASLAGCSELQNIAPAQTAAVEADVQDAYTLLCGTGVAGTGAVALLTPSSGILNANGQSALSTVQQICANGVPTNEVVVGVDIFVVATEVESLIGHKASAARMARLAHKHHAA
jgi:hypothetical protein